MMGLGWHDLVGTAGAALIVLAYFALQIGRLGKHSFTYLILNGLGASLILVSLTVEFNLSAFVIESFWVLISLYGLGRTFRARRAARSARVPEPPRDPTADCSDT